MLPGAWDREGCYQHAVALGAGAEALLGRVEGALAQGHGISGAAYAAARRFDTEWTVCVIRSLTVTRDVRPKATVMQQLPFAQAPKLSMETA